MGAESPLEGETGERSSGLAALGETCSPVLQADDETAVGTKKSNLSVQGLDPKKKGENRGHKSENTHQK